MSMRALRQTSGGHARASFGEERRVSVAKSTASRIGGPNSFA
jgi:hypothetical protein